MTTLPPSLTAGFASSGEIHAAAHGAWIEIDLEAVAANWRAISRKVAPAATAAAVKADAYGLGMQRVGDALWQAGCRHFFVAHLSEGAALRQTLPYALIHLLHGPPKGFEAEVLDYGLIPVLNNPAQLQAWIGLAQHLDRGPLPAVLHLDTGMTRLGISEADYLALLHDKSRLRHLDLRFVMSHLACADERGHSMNRAQLTQFGKLRAKLPDVEASFANSAGLFLGRPYHFDLVRPGIALYGGAPFPDEPNPMRPAISIKARILQTHTIKAPRTIGYGASYGIKQGRIATLPIGYADGWPRSLSNLGKAMIGPYECPYAGRVSMDLMTIDVSAVPDELLGPEAVVTLMGGPISLEQVAAWAGTNSYEIISRLGPRLARLYTGPYANSNDRQP